MLFDSVFLQIKGCKKEKYLNCLSLCCYKENYVSLFVKQNELWNLKQLDFRVLYI